MRTAWVLVLALFCSLLAACGPFDDDLGYRPVPAASVLAYDTAGTTQLAYLSGGQVLLDWGPSVGITQPLDAALWNRRFWLLAPGRILEVDLTAPGGGTSRPIASGVAALFAGDERLLALDTTTQQALLLRPGTAGFVQQPIALSFIPRSAVYLAGKWFAAGERLGTDSLYYSAIDEGAETLRRTAFVARGQLVSVQTDGLFVYLVLQGAGELAIWRIDTNAEVADFIQNLQVDAVHYSPLNRVFYGDEYTGRLTLSGGTVAPVGLAATSFAADFETSRIFHTTGGQLVRSTVNRSDAVLSSDTLVPFAGRLVGSWHLQLPQE